MPSPPRPDALAAATADERTLAKMALALGQRDRATVVFCECASEARRREVEAELARRLPDNHFYPFEAGQYPVVSLRRVLTEHLPDEVKESPPGQWVVHVHGLDISLLVSRDGQLVPSHLMAQLNLERERLFREPPYSTVIWGNADFFRRLRQEAPDLEHWVTYQFRFSDSNAQMPEEMPPLPPERLPERGDIEVRRARIVELTERLDHLNLNSDDTIRLRRDRLNTLSLRAAEYAEAFEYKLAAADYREAIQLAESVEALADTKAQLWFELGETYRLGRYNKEAVQAFERSLVLTSEANYGAINHQIGMAYQQQQQWAIALRYYQQALRWYEQSDEAFELGGTYHQIGTLYANQRQWSAALESYQQALNWDKKSDNLSELAATYHQIGRVYEEQQQWASALENYQQALHWRKQTGNLFELGGTYHQLGLVYEQQRQFASALEHYKQALHWNQQVGNTFALGGTYHQIGRILEIQDDISEAAVWYEKAVASLRKYSNAYLPNAKASLIRVRAALAQDPSPDEPAIPE